MKKPFCLLLVFIFIFSQGTVALADDIFSWDVYKSIAEDSFGDSAHYITLPEVNAQLWIPDYIHRVPLSDEDIASDAIASFMPDDGSSLIYISYFDASGISLESFKNSLSNSGIQANIESINGIPALVYYDNNSDALVVTYLTAESYFLQFMFWPLSDEVSSL